MKRLGVFLLLAPFLTACIADNDYYRSNTHYHQMSSGHSHAHAQAQVHGHGHGHGHSYHHPRLAVRNQQHGHQHPINRQQHGNTLNKPLTHANSTNIPAHGHD